MKYHSITIAHKLLELSKKKNVVIKIIPADPWL